jgi:hypothetical protein
MKFDIEECYEELLSHFKFHLDQKVLITTLLEDLHAFMCISPS